MAKVVIVNKKQEKKPVEIIPDAKAEGRELSPSPVMERVTAQGPDFTAVTDRKEADTKMRNENREPCLPFGMRGFFFGG